MDTSMKVDQNHSRGRRQAVAMFTGARRALVIGFFCTVGDIDSLALVRRWLKEAGVPFTVAPFGGPPLDAIPGSVLPESVDPLDYTHVIIVCGPCDRSYYSRRWPIDPAAFRHCHFVGVNLSMIEPVAKWNPFDTLLERNSERVVRPDLTFGVERGLTPVLGLCVIQNQPEYGGRQLHRRAEELLRSVARRHDAAVVAIDTGWPAALNHTGLESEAQIESLIARVDVLLTTRLHGIVYALKHGVPALVLDPVAGGDKVILQAQALGWPQAYLTEEASEDVLASGLDYCLSPCGRHKARECAAHARDFVSEIRNAFIAALEEGPCGAASRWPPRARDRRSLLQRVGGVCRRWLRAVGRSLLKIAGD